MCAINCLFTEYGLHSRTNVCVSGAGGKSMIKFMGFCQTSKADVYLRENNSVVVHFGAVCERDAVLSEFLDFRS